jgi:hypothetical protein
MEEGYFVVTRVHRDDLKEMGFDASEVSDETMTYLASKMANAYIENSFWIDLEIIGEHLEIKKLK